MTGERQQAPTVDGIRRDHVARYEFVAGREAGNRIVDAACGVGYGSKILAERGCTVTSFDRAPEAILYANQNYNHDDRISYALGDLYDAKAEEADAVVCFEALEHVADPDRVLQNFRGMASRLYVSVPNEEAFPYGGRIRHHFRHYRQSELSEILQKNGWQVTEWLGQETAESEVEPNVTGRTLIAVAQRVNGPVPMRTEIGAGIFALPERGLPHSVAIVAMGGSNSQYTAQCASLGGRFAAFDETWGINAMGGIIQCDRVFHMDDMRIQVKRAALEMEHLGRSQIAGMMNWMKHHPGPVYTSKAYDEFEGAEEYPLQFVLNATEHCYFNNTTPYALAFAIALGVKRIALFGCDYSYDRPEHAHKREKGRACLEYWIAVAASKGIEIQVGSESSLLDLNERRDGQPVFYGYDAEWVGVDAHDGKFVVSRVDRAESDIPTPEEMTLRYSHNPKLEQLVGRK